MVKRGQVWLLGRHRLLCGDATSKEDVETLLDGLTADLTLTDPPYGVSIRTDRMGGMYTKAYDGLLGDAATKYSPGVYEKVIGDEDTNCARINYEIAKEHSENQMLFGGNYFSDFLYPTRCWIVWDKKNGKDNSFADGELIWTSFDKNLKIYEWRWSGMIRKGSRDLELKKRIHPTQKPVGLLKEILEDFTDENATVLDCFAGSGSTLIACEVSGRTCYTMELSESYCEKIIDRWETLTGEKAELLM